MNKCSHLAFAVILILSLTLGAGAAEKNVALELIESARTRTNQGFGDVAKAKQLLDAGANPNIAGKYGWTALHYAAGWGNQQLVELLISKGANTKSMSTEQSPGGTPVGTTPLHIVSNAEIASILIKAGADVTARDGSGRTPMHKAAGSSSDVVELLLKKGASPNPQDSLGRTPLHECLERSKYYSPARVVQTVNLLIGAGCRLDQKDKAGKTAIDLCTQPILKPYLLKDFSSLTPFDALRLEDFNLLKMLVSTKAQASVKNDEGYTLLQMASSQGLLNAVEYLTGKGAELNAVYTAKKEHKAGQGLISIMERVESPLILALRSRHWKVAKYLVKNEADVNLVGKTLDFIGLVMLQGELVPISFATRFGQKEIVELMISNKADVNLADSEGNTALMEAAQKGNIEIAQLLIKAGASVDRKNKKGFDALKFAQENGHLDMIKWLESLQR